MKPCVECGKQKDLDEFHKNKCMADGSLNKCKECFSAYKKRYWIENKEKLQDYKRKHREEKSDHYKNYAKKYREQNIDSIKEKQKIRRSKTPEIIKTYNKEYASSDRGKSVRDEIQKKYLSTEKGKNLHNKASKKYVEQNPIKKKCHSAVRNAIKTGKLLPLSECEGCGSELRKLHAHHDDYSIPLSVTWFCAYCHKKWHKENGEGLNA